MPRTPKTFLHGALLSVLLACGDDPRPTLTWDELFEVRASMVLTDSLLAAIDGTLPGTTIKPRQVSGLSNPPIMMWTNRQGRELASAVMETPFEILDTPYWGSWFKKVGATNGHQVMAAANLLYPIHVYSLGGRWLDSVGSTPASWRQARSPQPGEFAPSRDEQARAYLQSFTMITGLAIVADSVLIVTHGRYRENPDLPLAQENWDGLGGGGTTELKHGLALVTTLLDVYVNGVRVASDQPAPGELFGHWGDAVFFLGSNAPEASWTLSQYAWIGAGT